MNQGVLQNPHATLTDLIYTNSSGVSYIAISDHSLVYVYRKISSDTEIFEILIVNIFEMKCLNKSGCSMNQKIQIWYGLTGKQNFCALLTHMLVFELDVLN